MASEFSISDIIEFGKNSQVNSAVKIFNEIAMKGSALDPNYYRKLYMIRKVVEFVNNAIPTYPTLRQVAEYLFALSKPFIVNPATISITIPANRTVNVGQNASFTVSVFVSNSSPYTIQWYRNNVAIPGATNPTYTLTNAQVSDSGATFYATATSPGVGTVSSTTAVLVVNAVITGFFAYMSSDTYATLQGNSDPFTYQTSFNIVHNANFTIAMPTPSSPNQYLIVKVPIGESVKATWYNNPFNNGTIPDFDWQTLLQFGGFTYYASRQALSLDTTATLILSP